MKSSPAPFYIRFLVPLVAFLCVVGIAGLQGNYDRFSSTFIALQRKKVTTFSEPLVPTPTALRALSLGDHPLVADILWLQTIQYFGQGDPYGAYPSLPKLIDTITQVDPNFEYPYEFGLVALPFMHAADVAAQIGERAQQQPLLKNNGLLTFYLASVYQINLKDYRKAAHYYELAAKQPGAPSAATELAGISLNHLNSSLNDRQVAILFWKTAYDTATDPDQKEKAKNWYLQMQIVYQLEQAAEQYKTDTGHFPADLQTLVQAKYISEIPDSPIGREMVLDPKTGKVNFDNLKQ